MAEFKDRKELEAWLKKQPRAVSIVIAARTALRVLPSLAVEFSEGKLKPDAVASDIILPVFRAVDVPWVAAKYPTRGTDFDAADAADAARAAYNAAGRAADAARAAYAAAHAAAAGRAADAAARAGYAAARAATAAMAAESAVVSPVTHRRRAVAAASTASRAASVAIWEAVSADATWIENGMAPEKLAGEPLWADKTPGWAKQNWGELQPTLLRLDPDWRVWTNWYEARLAGRLTYQYATPEQNERFKIACAMIDDAIWKKGPRVVFAEFKRLGKEILWEGAEGEEEPEREKPPEPEPGPGPEYAPKAGKLAAVAHIPLEAESEQSSKLHEQLRKKAKDFSRVIGPAANQYPELAEAATEYTELVDVPTNQLDVVAVWSVGGALAAFSGSYRAQNQTRTMASPLEPQLAAKLTSLIRDHGAFILGFEEGRDLVDRADQFALEVDVVKEIERPGNALLNELTDNRALVDEETRKVHEPVRDAVELGWTTSRVGYSAYVIVRKAVFAMIKHTVGEGKRPGEIAAILVGAGTGVSVLAGDPSAEFIRAAVPVLRDHGAQLLSFFNHSPEFRAYVEWALRVLDDDDKARDQN